jgi:hypothetical protein
MSEPTKAEIEGRLVTVRRLKEEAQGHIDKGDGAHWQGLYEILCEAEEVLQDLSGYNEIVAVQFESYREVSLTWEELPLLLASYEEEGAEDTLEAVVRLGMEACEGLAETLKGGAR